MAAYALVVSLALISASANPFLGEGHPMFPRDSPPQPLPQEDANPYSRRPSQELLEDPWSEMTVIKTHYDCRGFPMWREVSRIKSRAGEPVEVKTRKETLAGEKGDSAASEKPIFFQSMRSRLRNHPRAANSGSAAATPVTPPPPVTSDPRSRARPVPGQTLEAGPDMIIDTPAISCQEGYNEDYHGKCRRVFPN